MLTGKQVEEILCASLYDEDPSFALRARIDIPALVEALKRAVELLGHTVFPGRTPDYVREVITAQYFLREFEGEK